MMRVGLGGAERGAQERSNLRRQANWTGLGRGGTETGATGTLYPA